MIVESTEIPRFCALTSNGGGERLRAMGIAGYSLEAIVGLATQSRFLSQQGDSACLDFLAATQDKGLEAAFSCLSSSARKNTKASAPPEPFEFYRLGTTADILSDQFDLFCDRFRRGLQARWAKSGYGPLIQGLAEIADNVFEHSGNVGQSGCEALVGYHFGSHRAVFSIADTGQGFFGSLTTSARWRELASDRDALKAVVYEGATCRQKENSGGGFGQLFGSLVDFDALVVMRSGTCVGRVYQMEGTRKLDTIVGVGAVGVQVSIILGEHGQTEMLE